jgi:hypothetical protein
MKKTAILLVLFILAVPAVFSQDGSRLDPAFVDLVKKELAARGIASIEDHLADGYFVARENSEYFDKGNQIGLTNLFAICRQSDRAKWPSLVSGYFDQLKARRADEKAARARLEAFETAREILRVRIYGPEMKETLGETSLCRENPLGYVEAVMYDAPSGAGNVAASYLQKWGKSEDEVFRIAVENTLAGIRDKFVGFDVPNAMYLYLLGSESDIYVTSGIFDLPRFGLPAGDFGTLVAIPTREMIIAVPLQNKADVNRQVVLFALIAARMHKLGPASISPRIFWYDGSTLWPIDHDPDKGAIKLPDPLVRRLQ